MAKTTISKASLIIAIKAIIAIAMRDYSFAVRNKGKSHNMRFNVKEMKRHVGLYIHQNSMLAFNLQTIFKEIVQTAQIHLEITEYKENIKKLGGLFQKLLLEIERHKKRYKKRYKR